MKKILVLSLSLLSFTACFQVFAMGRSMSEEEVSAKKARAEADIQAVEETKKVEIEAEKARKLAAIEAEETNTKNRALAAQLEAEHKELEQRIVSAEEPIV